MQHGLAQKMMVAPPEELLLQLPQQQRKEAIPRGHRRRW